MIIDALADPSKAITTEADPVIKPPPNQQGELLFKIPDQMVLEQAEKCIVRIALNEDEIVRNIELDKNVALRQLSRVSDLMQVVLVDPNSDEAFAIRTINEPEQLIFEDAYTEWIFSRYIHCYIDRFFKYQLSLSLFVMDQFDH